MTAECPRCGYDQRGVVEAWHESCPLEGTCAECGLAFAWRDLLHPAYGMPRWCVEARRPWPAWPVQAAGTAIRSAWPWRYWSSMALHQPIRWPRLVAYAATLSLVLVLAAHLSSAILGVADHRGTQGLGFTSSTSDAAIFFAVARNPFSEAPLARYSMQRPAGVFNTVGLSPSNLTHGLWLVWWRMILVVLLTPFTTALAFAALPQTRSRARVRWRHIARVAMHGIIVPFAVLVLGVGGSLWSALLDPPIPRPHVLHGLAILVYLLGTLLWWYAAVRFYLRMRPALAVAAIAVSIGLLGPVSIMGALWFLAA